MEQDLTLEKEINLPLEHPLADDIMVEQLALNSTDPLTNASHRDAGNRDRMGLGVAGLLASALDQRLPSTVDREAGQGDDDPPAPGGRQRLN